MRWLPGIFRDVTLQARPVDGIDDAFVHASCDHHTGEGSRTLEASRGGRAINAVVRVPELDPELPAGTEVRIPAVEPWSAEVPRLYEAVISTPGQALTLQVGFRSIAIEDAQFKVNGRRILLRGVNRHEHHPRLGRAVLQDVVETELRLRKQHNINAIRTSHYRPHPGFLASPIGSASTWCWSATSRCTASRAAGAVNVRDAELQLGPVVFSRITGMPTSMAASLQRSWRWWWPPTDNDLGPGMGRY